MSVFDENRHPRDRMTKGQYKEMKMNKFKDRSDEMVKSAASVHPKGNWRDPDRFYFTTPEDPPTRIYVDGPNAERIVELSEDIKFYRHMSAIAHVLCIGFEEYEETHQLEVLTQTLLWINEKIGVFDTEYKKLVKQDTIKKEEQMAPNFDKKTKTNPQKNYTTGELDAHTLHTFQDGDKYKIHVSLGDNVKKEWIADNNDQRGEMLMEALGYISDCEDEIAMAEDEANEEN